MAKKEEIVEVTNETEIEVTSVTVSGMIHIIRGKQVILDSDLAMLYQVETKVFNQSVTRNIERFPVNFRFQLTKEEYDALRSQNATSNGRGGRRYLPFAFTEQGMPESAKAKEEHYKKTCICTGEQAEQFKRQDRLYVKSQETGTPLCSV